jgi:hypothetical protein
VPFGALMLSDLYLDRYYAVEFHYHWPLGGALIRLGCFAAGLGIGLLVSRRRTWYTLIGGTLGASALFYLVTNTASWAGDAGYAHDFSGWIQALTVGHPQFPSTLYFFRNTLASDVIFTALFSGVLEWAVRRRGQASLLAGRAGD